MEKLRLREVKLPTQSCIANMWYEPRYIRFKGTYNFDSTLLNSHREQDMAYGF